MKSSVCFLSACLLLAEGLSGSVAIAGTASSRFNMPAKKLYESVLKKLQQGHSIRLASRLLFDEEQLTLSFRAEAPQISEQAEAAFEEDLMKKAQALKLTPEGMKAVKEAAEAARKKDPNDCNAVPCEFYVVSVVPDSESTATLQVSVLFVGGRSSFDALKPMGDAEKSLLEQRASEAFVRKVVEDPLEEKNRPRQEEPKKSDKQ